jgi:hypothetical protein
MSSLPDSGAPLVAAVAAIVALAAERARAAGELPALLDALDGVLAPANDALDPREAMAADLPCIADADPLAEATRLRALARHRSPD